MDIYKVKGLLYNKDTLKPDGLILAWPANLMEDAYAIINPASGFIIIESPFMGGSTKGHTRTAVWLLCFIKGRKNIK